MVRCLRGVAIIALGTIGLVACGSDTAGPAPITSPDVFWSLTFQWPAVNLALTVPYDTAQLIAIPRTAAGTVLDDTTKVQYSTSDSAIAVSAAGLVTARFPTPGAIVVARMTTQGITLTDTAIVQVTETPPPAPLGTLSIHPQPGVVAPARILVQPHMFVDLLRIQILPFYATLTTGDSICNFRGCPEYPLVVHFAASDSTIASIDQTGVVTPHRVGRVMLSVSTLAYGVYKTDSLSFAVGYSGRVLNSVYVDSTQHPFAPYVPEDSLPAILSVGGQVGVTNYADPGQLVEIETPGLPHGVHFVGLDSTQVKDTLNNLDFIFARFDSVGTYTIRYRLLSTGATTSSTFVIKGFP